jgi:outer membrane protein
MIPLRPLFRLTLAGLAQSIAFWALPGQASAQDQRLTLQRAVEMGLDTHPQIGAAQDSRLGAEAGLGQAKSRWWPTLQFDGNLTTFQLPMLVNPIHEVSTTAFIFDNTLIQSQTRLDFTLFDGGGRTARIAQARAGLEEAEAGAEVAEDEVIERVTDAYLRALAAAAIDSAQGLRLDVLAAEQRRVELFLEQGRAAEVELLRIRAALAEARAERVTTMKDAENASRELARLIGIDAPAAAPGRLTGVVTPTEPPEDRTSLSARALTANPQIRRAQNAVAAEEAGRRAAKSMWLPSLHVGGALLTYGSTAGNFSAEWNAGVAVSYPLFTGFERSNRVAQANAQADRAANELRLLELDVESLVDRAIAAVEESDARVDALTQAVTHLTEVSRIERLALDVGTGVQTEFLRAEADLYQARANLVRASHNAAAARVALARAVGELSLDWLRTHLENAS